ncbi:MAG: zinc-binding dehydrogenase [Oscillospiraceae bacterium]|nr:zinc-binding dehydrogenase [Oscillospiraceae bacterium]
MALAKRAVVSDVKKISLVDYKIPEPKEDWVLVKVQAIPLCTQYKGWVKGTNSAGHEAAGEVVAVGPYSTKVKVGDRVVVMPGWPCGKCELCIRGEYIHCQHWHDYHEQTGLDFDGDTHVQYLLKQDWLLAHIPDGVSYEKASLACCGLGPTFGALERFKASKFDTVLIIGAGPVGLGGIVNAKYRGCKVISVDMIDYRKNLATELGADLVLDASDPEVNKKIMQFTGNKGVDIALEVSGSNPGARLGIDSLRRHGTMAFIGENEKIEIHVSRDLIRKGIQICGQWHYNINGIPKIMDVILNSPVVDKLITHKYPMTDMDTAMAICASQKCGKVMIDPHK